MKKLHGEMLREALRQNLKKFRKEAHFSQEQIAQQLGVNRATYTYYETGKTTPAWRIYTCSPSCTAAPWRSFSSDPPNSKRRAAASAAALLSLWKKPFMGANRPQRRGRWPLLLVLLFSRCAAFKSVGRCPFSPNGSVKRWTVPAGHQRPCKLFEKRLLRPSGTLPNSRPSRQTRRAKTLR